MYSDNHMHTQYCPHGSDEPMEKYVKAALIKGLKSITFTEHAPLPIEDSTPSKDSSMEKTDVTLYLEEGQRLIEKYRDTIQINLGFEIDYIEGREEETLRFLQAYPETVPYSILSVHFLKLSEADYFCIDFSKETFKDKAMEVGYSKLYNIYEKSLVRALSRPYGKWTPSAIGHITLIQKFKNELDEQDTIDWNTILDKVKESNYKLDYNFAGIDKPEYGQTYPYDRLVGLALEKGIELQYGSDAHHPDEIGRYFERGINNG